jgi:hypothetical protein
MQSRKVQGSAHAPMEQSSEMPKNVLRNIVSVCFFGFISFFPRGIIGAKILKKIRLCLSIYIK